MRTVHMIYGEWVNFQGEVILSKYFGPPSEKGCNQNGINLLPVAAKSFFLW